MCVGSRTSGCNRIEMCTSPAEGGITCFGMLRQDQRFVRIPVHPIVRPRSGDFVIQADFSAMKMILFDP